MKKSELRKFRHILRLFDRELYLQNSASCCNGITLTQCHTLLEVEAHPGLAITALADKMALDKSTVSRTADGLVNLGLLDREIPAHNRRMAVLNLTNQGKKVCRGIHFANDRDILKCLDDFTAEDKEHLLRLFEKLVKNMIRIRLNS